MTMMPGSGTSSCRSPWGSALGAQPSPEVERAQGASRARVPGMGTSIRLLVGPPEDPRSLPAGRWRSRPRYRARSRPTTRTSSPIRERQHDREGTEGGDPHFPSGWQLSPCSRLPPASRCSWGPRTFIRPGSGFKRWRQFRRTAPVMYVLGLLRPAPKRCIGCDIRAAPDRRRRPGLQLAAGGRPEDSEAGDEGRVPRTAFALTLTTATTSHSRSQACPASRRRPRRQR